MYRTELNCTYQETNNYQSYIGMPEYGVIHEYAIKKQHSINFLIHFLLHTCIILIYIQKYNEIN